jgi:hypothetical protein
MARKREKKVKKSNRISKHKLKNMNNMKKKTILMSVIPPKKHLILKIRWL